MNSSNKRNLPSILEEDYFLRYNIQPTFYTENPENTLALNEASEYLNVIKEKIKSDHLENMTKIKSNHEEVMESIRNNAINNYAQTYLNKVSEEEASKVDGFEALPYVEEDGLFWKRKALGTTIRIKRKAS
ncbi:MAG: hypothetical protein NUV46_00305 [Nanoarchaeota archaeon]|nr:hypothetical protein [Nanoarchaeota archaeon]